MRHRLHAREQSRVLESRAIMKTKRCTNTARQVAPTPVSCYREPKPVFGGTSRRLVGAACLVQPCQSIAMARERRDFP